MYLSILALSALLAVNALSVDTGLHARHAHLGQAFAKRDSTKRCKSRSSTPPAYPASSPVPSPSPVVAPSPSSTTTPPPVSTVSSSSSSPGNAKAGLAFAVWDDTVGTVLANFKTSHVSLAYNWGPTKIPGAEALGYIDVPMLWGTKDLDQWKQLVVPGYSSYAIGFNEPNLQGDSYLDPGYACQLWQQNMLPLRGNGYQLVGPGLTSDPLSVNWMKSFLNNCGADSVDKMNIHWYGIDHDAFIQYLQLWYNTFQKPMWVTEFACQDFVNNVPCPDVDAFAGAVRNFMDNTAWVEAYFPFAITPNLGNVNGVNQLLGQDLKPTTLAQIYFN